MNDKANVGFLLGIGSYCRMTLRYGANAGALTGGTSIGPIRIPMTSANYDRQRSVPTQGSYQTGMEGINAYSRGGRFRTGVGTYAYSGSLAFDVTDEIRELIFDTSLGFFQRRSFLDLELFDGEGLLNLPGCVWSSFTLNASAQNLINAQISFSSCNSFLHKINIESTYENLDYHDFPKLDPYWQYGNPGIQDFSLSISRSVTPVYLNEKHWIGPSYQRVGLMDASFSITCWQEWFDYNEIVLVDRVLTFQDPAFQGSRGYQFAGNAGEGMKTYTNNATSLEGDGDLFIITPKVDYSNMEDE